MDVDKWLVLVVVARLAAAFVNIVHDCDEVYNYWEPLHYLLHGSGMQTWEYSAKHALRPYLYILLHWPLARAAQVVAAALGHKAWTFYLVRAALSLVAAVLDVRLIRAWRGRGGHAAPLALLLALSAGCFLAPATLLPSTFAMYCMTAATTGVLAGRVQEVVVASTVAVLLGWPVAGVAFAPYIVYVLCSRRLARSFATLFLTAAPLLAAIAATDAYFYGRPTLSLWNFVKYNVAGGGESARYGVEPWSFYLRNGALNLGLALPLALAYPCLALLQGAGRAGSRLDWRVVTAAAPLAVWLPAISVLPHKEERFLYVVYPQIVLAAAATLDSVPALASTLLASKTIARRRDSIRSWAAGLRSVVLAVAILMAVSRSAAVLRYYQAPMAAWWELHNTMQARDRSSAHCGTVCVGEEWHRYPSSFFIPEGARLAFVDSAFDGLLPKQFDSSAGGTRAAPVELNSENRKDDRLVLPNLSQCGAFVALQGHERVDSTWRAVARHAFLENSAARFPYRAFWLPGWEAKLPWSAYVAYVSSDCL